MFTEFISLIKQKALFTNNKPLQLYGVFYNSQPLFDILNPVNLGWAGECNPPTKIAL